MAVSSDNKYSERDLAKSTTPPYVSQFLSKKWRNIRFLVTKKVHAFDNVETKFFDALTRTFRHACIVIVAIVR